MVERADIVDDQRRPFEWWMASHLALALAFNCFLPVLLPAYVLSVGGSAIDITLAMSMAGLFANFGSEGWRSAYSVCSCGSPVALRLSESANRRLVAPQRTNRRAPWYP